MEGSFQMFELKYFRHFLWQINTLINLFSFNFYNSWRKLNWLFSFAQNIFQTTKRRLIYQLSE